MEALRISEERLDVALKGTQESHERLLTILNGLDAIVYVADMETQELLFLNQYGKETFGEIVGQPCWKTLQAGMTGPCPFCTNDKLVDTVGNPAGTYSWEFNNTVNGRWYYMRDRALLWADGRIVRLEIATDITDRKRAESEREKLEIQSRQLQKMESLGRMAGAIAHHFNNQLAAVMLNLDLAISDLPRNAGPVESLTEAMQSVQKAVEISTLMLTYLGQTTVKCEPLDLSEVCRQSLSMLRSGLPKNMVLESDLASPGPTVFASVNQLQQLITNLVTNAWEASDAGEGFIRLTVQTVPAAVIPAANRFPIDWQPQDTAYACLKVADAGCGIANENIEKIFDPFYSTKFTGRGMGLAVVFGIVRALHGTVTVETAPGRGSTFQIFLTVSTVGVPQIPFQAVPAPITAGSPTVLMFEDEPGVRNVAKVALKRLGFTGQAAMDGIEAGEYSVNDERKEH